MATCRSCGREIVWAKHDDGDLIALDTTVAIDGERYSLEYEEGEGLKPQAIPISRFGFQGHRLHDCDRPLAAT